MKYYIEAYRGDGSQILGNLDGQGVIRAKRPHRSALYRCLATGQNRPMYQHVHHWRLVTEDGKLLEEITNKWRNEL
jgi:hypothetical protein